MMLRTRGRSVKAETDSPPRRQERQENHFQNNTVSVVVSSDMFVVNRFSEKDRFCLSWRSWRLGGKRF
jgi:hypothetical protein